MDQQEQVVRRLQKTVRGTTEFAKAQASDQLIRLPTGDGMALVFFGDPEAPARCALEVSRYLRGDPEIKLRMGIHTGPVYRVTDINANRNVAGGGINIAQRVMDCGDAGHILVSSSVAEVLSQVSTWKNALHDLGEAEVKHGVRVHVYNLCTDDAGNPELPQRLHVGQKTVSPAHSVGKTKKLSLRAVPQCLKWERKSRRVSNLAAPAAERVLQTAPPKYYVYLSNAKLDMLASQLSGSLPSGAGTTAQIGIKSILSVERKMIEDNPSNKYAKLEAVLGWLRRYSDIGPIGATASYIEDSVPMVWGVFHVSPDQDLGDKAPVVFCAKTESFRLLMFGSPVHLIGAPPETARGMRWSGDECVQHLLAKLNEQPELLDADGFKQSVKKSHVGDLYFAPPLKYEDCVEVIFTQAYTTIASPKSTLHFLAKRLTTIPARLGSVDSRLVSFPYSVVAGTPIVVGTPICVDLVE